MIAAVAFLFFAQAVNPHAATLADFETRVANYEKLRDRVEAMLPTLKPTDAPSAIDAHERELGKKIVIERANAKQGEIFTPEIATEFKRLLSLTAPTPEESRKIRHSLRHSEPVHVDIKVNEVYPRSIPVQSTPANVLMNLPKLPRGLEYRINGPDLILLDTGCNLVVDIDSNAMFPALRPETRK